MAFGELGSIFYSFKKYKLTESVQNQNIYEAVF